jgi:hypothetical protein
MSKFLATGRLQAGHNAQGYRGIVRPSIVDWAKKSAKGRIETMGSFKVVIEHIFNSPRPEDPDFSKSLKTFSNASEIVLRQYSVQRRRIKAVIRRIKRQKHCCAQPLAKELVHVERAVFFKVRLRVARMFLSHSDEQTSQLAIDRMRTIETDGSLASITPIDD